MENLNIQITHTFFPSENCIICGVADKSQVAVGVYDVDGATPKEVVTVRICTSHLFSLLVDDALKIHNDDLMLHELSNFLTGEDVSSRVAINTFSNFFKLKTYRSLESFSGAGAGMSCAIVGAGPSLDSTIARLKAHEDNYVVLASLQAVPSLLAAGVRIDLVFSLDSSAANSTHISGRGAIEGRVVLDPSVDCGVFDVFSDAPFLASMVAPGFNPALDALGDAVPSMVSAEAGYSVILAMISFASFCGFRSVHLFGVDCAFSGTASHARDYKLEKMIQTDGVDFVHVKNFLGTESRTSPAYLAQAQLINAFARRYALGVFVHSDIFPSLPFLLYGSEDSVSGFFPIDNAGRVKAFHSSVLSVPVWDIDRVTFVARISAILSAFEVLLVAALREFALLNSFLSADSATDDIKRDISFISGGLTAFLRDDFGGFEFFELLRCFILDLEHYMLMVDGAVPSAGDDDVLDVRRGYIFLKVLIDRLNGVISFLRSLL